jgi:hypothetical protein
LQLVGGEDGLDLFARREFAFAAQALGLGRGFLEGLELGDLRQLADRPDGGDPVDVVRHLAYST